MHLNIYENIFFIQHLLFLDLLVIMIKLLIQKVKSKVHDYYFKKFISFKIMQFNYQLLHQANFLLILQLFILQTSHFYIQIIIHFINLCLFLN